MLQALREPLTLAQQKAYLARWESMEVRGQGDGGLGQQRRARTSMPPIPLAPHGRSLRLGGRL